ncbi:hypothetical protein SUGI_0296840 [Cryptomeria japonica]|nr:hypothetical protein SUGI_0296840 [Cryptomeria japonica]
METLTSSNAWARENASEISILSQKTRQSSHAFRNLSDLLTARSGFVHDKGVECQGFSIREYVMKVRSVNIRKCWPFSEGLLEDGLNGGVEHLLPPLNRPYNKACACQNCAEEQRNLETSFQKSQLHGDPPESCFSTVDGTKDRQMTVCLSPCSEAALNISKDLEEQIRKLSTVQISGQDESGAEGEDDKQKKEPKDARFGRPFFRAESSNIGTLDCTTQSAGDGKPAREHKKEEAVTNDTAVENQDGKPDTAICKDSPKERQGRSFRFDLTESDCQIFMDVGIREETEKAKEVAHDQVPGGSLSKQSERSNIENLNSQAIKTESVTQSLSNISNDEVSAIKIICPVCKTFSSATITAVNAHIDDCLAQASKAEKRHDRMQNHKSRKQKKRSIADICAVAPPNHTHFDDLQNLGTRESVGSPTPNCKLKKTIGTVQRGLASAICDDLPSFKCKRKRASRGSSLIQHGKSGNGGAGAAGSLDTKRKRPHLGIIPSISKGVEDLRMPLAASHCPRTDHGVEHHLSIEEESRDLNFEQSQSTEVNQVQNCDLLTNHHQLSDKRMDHIHSVCMLPKEERTKEGIISNCTTQVDESGMILGDDNTVDPSVKPTMATSATDVHHSCVMSDTKILRNDLHNSNNEQSNILCDGTRLHVEETSRKGDPNLVNLSNKSPVNKMLTSFNPENAGEAQKSNGIYEKLECRVMDSLKEDCPLIETEISDSPAEPVRSEYKFVAKTDIINVQVENTKNILGDASTSSSLSIQSFERGKESPMENGRVIWDTRKVTEGGHIQNIQLDLNKKACVIPRDFKGRFLSSHSTDGSQDDSLYPQCNQAPRRKSTKPPRSLLNSSVKEEYNNVEAHLSENGNAKDRVDLSIHGNCSVNGSIGLPLDSEKELVKPISYSGQGFNQRYKIPNYAVSNQPQGTQRDFNFVESSKTCHDATSVNQPLQTWSSKCLSQENYSIQFKQPDYQQEYSVSNTNQSNPDKGLSEHSSLPDKIQTSKMLCESPSLGIASSSIASPDAFSMFAMQSNVQSEYNEDQSQKASSLEKIHPQLDITKRKQSTTQPVMRLMGQSFIIGDKNEFKNSFKHPQQCNTTDTDTQTPSRSPMGATTCVSSTMQRMTAYIGCCTACNTGQFGLPCPEGNALCPHCRVKTNTSKSIQHNFKEAHSLGVMESIANHQNRTFDNNVPKLVERKVSTNYVHGHSLKERSYSGKAWISNLPFSAPKANMLISPVRDLCNKTDLNKGHKIKYKDSHVSNWDCSVQKQTYRQLLDSCLEKSAFQKQESNGWSYTSSSCSPQIYSDVCKSSSCPIDNFGHLSGPPHSFTCAIAHIPYFPFKKQAHCQIPSSYASIADSPTLVMPDQYIYSPITSDKSDELVLKFPMITTIKTNDTIHQKLGVTDAAIADRKRKGNPRTREFVTETKGLLGKCISEKHEDCGTDPMEKSVTFSETEDMHKRKRVINQGIFPSNVASKHLRRPEKTKSNMLGFRHSEISRTNKTRVESSSDGGNSSSMVENESILNVPSHAGFSQNCPENERSSLKFTEPKKLIGGMKHIRKPFPQNGNGKQFLPMHFTLPYAETSAGERNKIWKM